MRQRLFTLCAILSLLLGAAVCVLWARSYRAGPHDQLSCRLGRDRYTARAAAGRFEVLGPPPGTIGGGTAADVDALSAANIRWHVNASRYPVPAERGLAESDGRLSAACLGTLPVWHSAADSRRLLAALEDPRRFAAAHVALRWIVKGPYKAGARWEGDGIVAGHDGLVVRIRTTLQPPELDFTRRAGRGPSPGRLQFSAGGSAASIDPAQLPMIRRQWHDRLDVRHAALPLPAVVAALLILPGAWAWRLRRGRVLRRLGRCPTCGYDLRATPDRCPECGAERASALKGTA